MKTAATAVLIAILAVTAACGSTPSDEARERATASFCAHMATLSTVFARIYPYPAGPDVGRIERSEVDELVSLRRDFAGDARLFDEVSFTTVSEVDMARVAGEMADELDQLGALIEEGGPVARLATAIERVLSAYADAPSGFCSSPSLRRGVRSIAVSSACLNVGRLSGLADELRGTTAPPGDAPKRILAMASAFGLDSRLLNRTEGEAKLANTLRALADALAAWGRAMAQDGDLHVDKAREVANEAAMLPAGLCE